MQFAMLDLEVVLVAGNVLVDADLRLRCAVMLNLNLEMERCDTLECDRNDLFTLCLSRAVAVSLTGFVEACVRTRMYRLLDSDGSEMLLGRIVLAICKTREDVVVSTSFRGLCSDRGSAAGSVQVSIASDKSSFPFLVLEFFPIHNIEGRVS